MIGVVAGVSGLAGGAFFGGGGFAGGLHGFAAGDFCCVHRRFGREFLQRLFARLLGKRGPLLKRGVFVSSHSKNISCSIASARAGG